MRTIEYRFIDKSAWADGPWHHEPDKRQWEVDGLYCLILRNGMLGNLCGYVGLPPDHPAYGLHYDGVTDAEAKARRAAFLEDMKQWRDAGYPQLKKWRARSGRKELPPDEPFPGIGEYLANIEVHGGLTFAGFGNKATPELWQRLRYAAERWRPEAIRHPRGDSARALLEYGKAIDDYEVFVTQTRMTGLYCEMEPGEPEDLWFFGFDCGHAWDIQPGMDAMMEELKMPRFIRDQGLRFTAFGPDTIYRDLAYVEIQVIALALQLAKVQSSAMSQIKLTPC
jgi:hypothetical protein